LKELQRDRSDHNKITLMIRLALLAAESLVLPVTIGTSWII